MIPILLGYLLPWGALCLLRKRFFWSFALQTFTVLVVTAILVSTTWIATLPSMREFPLFFVVGTFLPVIKLLAGLAVFLVFVVELALVLIKKKVHSFRSFLGSRYLSLAGAAAMAAWACGFFWGIAQKQAEGLTEQEKQAYESVLGDCDKAKSASRLEIKNQAWTVGDHPGYGTMGAHLESPVDALFQSCFDDLKRTPENGGIAQFRKENDIYYDESGLNWTLKEFRKVTISLSAFAEGPQDSLDAIYRRWKEGAVSGYLLIDGKRKMDLGLKGHSSGGGGDTVLIGGQGYPQYATLQWTLDYADLLEAGAQTLELILEGTSPKFSITIPTAFLKEPQFSLVTD